MKEITTFLEHQYSLLLIAPPGWGKTRMLIQMIQESQNTWVFISPLRALANEFFLAVKDKISKTYLIESHADFREHVKLKRKYKLLIVTPELISLKDIDLKSIIVWDEFHLNYYWGDTFRERLNDLYYEIAIDKRALLQLTATMSEENLKRWKLEMSLNYEHSLCINVGNQCLKNLPKSYYFYPNIFKKYFLKNLELDILLNKRNTVILFCRYRKQVDYFKEYFQIKGIKVLGCKGGETKEFIDKLQNNWDVELIVATTAISHGVNLPPISRVYFSYSVDNRDFWIQMVGRGGRRGESFEVHTMDYEKECGNKLKTILNVFVFFFKLKLKTLFIKK